MFNTVKVRLDSRAFAHAMRKESKRQEKDAKIVAEYFFTERNLEWFPENHEAQRRYIKAAKKIAKHDLAACLANEDVREWAKNL